MEIKLNPHARVEIRSVPSADIIDVRLNNNHIPDLTVNHPCLRK